MKTIDNIVDTLTPEERESLKELIEECRNRETEIRQNKQILQQEIQKFNKISQKLIEDIKSFYLTIMELEKACEENYNKIKTTYFNSIDDEKFYRA